MVPGSFLVSQSSSGHGHRQPADAASAELSVVPSAWPLLVQQLLVVPDARWQVQLYSLSCLQVLCLDAPMTGVSRRQSGSPIALKPILISSFLLLTLASLGGMSFLLGSVINATLPIGCLKLLILEDSFPLLPLLQITPQLWCCGKIKPRKICKLILLRCWHISPEAIEQKVRDQFE